VPVKCLTIKIAKRSALEFEAMNFFLAASILSGWADFTAERNASGPDELAAAVDEVLKIEKKDTNKTEKIDARFREFIKSSYFHMGHC
jgi:hypothetical protein